MDAREEGFTLIELLIVVVIIGILASIAIPKFAGVRDKAYLSAVRADLRNLAVLQDAYFNEHYTYGTDLNALGFIQSEGVTVTPAEGTGSGWSASAMHAGLPTESCAIFHGEAAPLTPATVLSVVQCSR